MWRREEEEDAQVFAMNVRAELPSRPRPNHPVTPCQGQAYRGVIPAQWPQLLGARVTPFTQAPPRLRKRKGSPDALQTISSYVRCLC